MSETPRAVCNTKRYAFTGAHGTGKTTLVRQLHESLTQRGTNTAIVPEVPREIGSFVNDNQYYRRGRNSFARQLMLLIGQPIYEALSTREANLVFCDRTILDHWAYTRVLFKEDLEGMGTDPTIALILQSLVHKYLATYDLIFYVPIEFLPIDDGTRESDVEFQRTVDREIVKLLKDFAISYVEVHGTIAERVHEVLNTLGSETLMRCEHV